MSNDDLVTVSITGLAYGGSFIGEIEDGPPERIGQKAFIRFVAPGERVRARITADHKRYVEAEPISFLTKSSERREPPCPLFERCGGCDLQHIPIERQRQSKTELVRSTLAKQARITPPKGVTLLGESLPELFYRRRVRLHLSPAGEIGFFAAGTGSVVPLSRCFLASSEINSAISELAPHLAPIASDVGAIVIEDLPSGIAVALEPRPGCSTEDAAHLFRQKLPNLRVSTHRIGNQESDELLTVGHFSQVNQAANELLIACVKERLPGSELTELYAGAGNFTLPLAQAGKRITAVELDTTLVHRARRELTEAKLDSQVQFVQQSCERFVKAHSLSKAVLLDPPRCGARGVVSHFASKGVRHVVYVSCNVPTLTRDLATLVQDGFTVTETVVIDMFPQTHHVETVTVLERQ